MKRLLTLMLACAAILVMGITAANVAARDGADDGTQAACDVRHENEAGDDHGTDSRAIASDDSNGTSSARNGISSVGPTHTPSKKSQPPTLAGVSG